MTVDPFTRASATYQAATRSRLAFKSGAAYEGWTPRPPSRLPAILFWSAFAFLVFTLLSMRG